MVDQGAQAGDDLGARGGVGGQRFVELFDLGAIVGGDRRVERDHRQLVELLELRGGLVAIGAGEAQGVEDLGKFLAAGSHGRDQAVNPGSEFAMSALQLLSGIAALTRAAGVGVVIFAHVDVDQRGIEHALAQARQHPSFHERGRDTATVGAGLRATFLVARAAPAVRPADGPGAAAGAAAGESGKHVFRPA